MTIGSGLYVPPNLGVSRGAILDPYPAWDYVDTFEGAGNAEGRSPIKGTNAWSVIGGDAIWATVGDQLTADDEGSPYDDEIGIDCEAADGTIVANWTTGSAYASGVLLGRCAAANQNIAVVLFVGSDSITVYEDGASRGTKAAAGITASTPYEVKLVLDGANWEVFIDSVSKLSGSNLTTRLTETVHGFEASDITGVEYDSFYFAGA